MSTAIRVDEGVKNRLQLFGREDESYDEILNRLMDSLEELDVEEIIEARWLKLQKEKKDYITLEDV
jgi:predicted flavoprotein YhiN